MSDPQQEQSKGARAAETKRFWIKTSLVILFFFSAANIFLLLFIVPKFEQIYQDALSGMPLPTMTQFIITHRVAIAFINLIWPILGTVLLRLQKPYAILWINTGMVWCFLQVGNTLIALIMPMTGGPIVGMGEGH